MVLGARGSGIGGRGSGLGLDRGSSPRTLLKLGAYGREISHLLAALLACIAAGSLLDLAVPWVTGFLLLDQVIKRADLSALPWVAGLLAAIFLGQKLFSFLQEYFHELANQRFIHRLRCDLFEHVERLPVRFFDQGRTGEILARVTSDVNQVEGLLSTLVKDFFAEAIMLAGSIVFLYAVNPRLTWVVLPTVPALAASVFLFKRSAKRNARAIRDLLGELTATAAQTIEGVRVVKACGAEPFEAARFGARSLDVLRARVKNTGLQALYSSTIDAWVFIGTIIIILVATPRVVAGELTVGAFVAYLGYLQKLYGPTKKLSKVNISIQKIVAAGDRIFEVMQQPLEGGLVRTPPADRTGELPPAGDGGIAQESGAPVPAGGGVRFEAVSFEYRPERPVLRAFGLTVAPGELVALVGHSGGGKTTVANLLLGFYRPTAGRILIDRVPIEAMPLATLRQQIGFVPQEPFLFSGSVQENIAYARPDASMEEIVQAAGAANAHEFIVELPHGYQTPVGERGVQLSAGQRQRVAIARAFLRSPRILIFDEATAHLDAESERLIQQALGRIARGRTVFVIAHRLSTVCRADKIVVIEDGEIVQLGTHDDLLARDGLYRRLYTLQLSPPTAESKVKALG